MREVWFTDLLVVEDMANNKFVIDFTKGLNVLLISNIKVNKSENSEESFWLSYTKIDLILKQIKYKSGAIETFNIADYEGSTETINMKYIDQLTFSYNGKGTRTTESISLSFTTSLSISEWIYILEDGSKTLVGYKYDREIYLLKPEYLDDILKYYYNAALEVLTPKEEEQKHTKSSIKNPYYNKVAVIKEAVKNGEVDAIKMTDILNTLNGGDQDV